ncbi:glycosyltransferase family 4 protein [Thermodesulfovibrio sp.]|uniref:glycosyltransferase family 4 protein n=1 Tax=Thermodesulfovibrio sp. TaxID=2067987 RepID=UPI0030AF29F9
MKILFVNHSSSLTGAPISCFNIMTRLNEDLIPVFATKEKELLLDKLKNHGIKSYVISEKGFLGFKYILSFIKIITNEKIDLIHLNTLTPFCKYAAIAGFIKKIPIVWVVRENPLISRSQRLKWWLKKFSSKIIFVDNDTKEKLLGKQCKEKVETIYNGVDLEYFKPEKSDFLFKLLNIQKNHKLIGYIGLIAERKGVKFLVNAFHEVKKLFPLTKLVIVGGYKENDILYFEQIKQLIKELNLEKDVYFTGVLQNIKDVINSLEIVILPSLEERCSRVLLETIACGKVVVATDVGGNPEIIQDGINGILVKPADSKDLEGAIMKLLKDENLREEFSKNSRLIAEKKFDININLNKMKKIYREIAHK